MSSKCTCQHVFSRCYLLNMIICPGTISFAEYNGFQFGRYYGRLHTTSFVHSNSRTDHRIYFAVQVCRLLGNGFNYLSNHQRRECCLCYISFSSIFCNNRLIRHSIPAVVTYRICGYQDMLLEDWAIAADAAIFEIQVFARGFSACAI
jgi:hypothetical protein